ncbi:hypothetical protein HDU99_003376, partial [Rhizoclosmatium hyalinum]
MDDHIIAKMLEERAIMTDVCPSAEMVRRERMFVMLRWSKKYQQLQAEDANYKWQCNIGDDLTEMDQSFQMETDPSNFSHVSDRGIPPISISPKIKDNIEKPATDEEYDSDASTLGDSESNNQN